MRRYEIVLTETAKKRLLSAPEKHRKDLISKLKQLAIAPATLSEKAPSPPYPPGYQVFKVFVNDDRRHMYSVLFQYASNEVQLIVAIIGHVEYAD